MINAIIIDDEKFCIEVMEELISTHCPGIAIAASCQSGEEGIAAIGRHQPDLIFLDIEMPRMNGFDLLKKLLPFHFDVIFTTAYDNYAIRAFKYSALDYLLKPIEPKRLTDAIQKVQYEMSKKREGVNGMINRGPLTEIDQVFVKDGERCWFVKLGEVRLFESVGNYAKVFFGNNKPLILKSLNALEERLDEKVFFRANRKHIVNLRMIEKIEPYFNGGLLLELKGGDKIEVSRRQTVKFKEMMSL